MSKRAGSGTKRRVGGETAEGEPEKRVAKVDIRDVAAAAGVSIATVSRVLSGRGSTALKTRENVQRVAAELGYRPNEAGRMLRTRESGAVALMISSMNNSFYAAIATEIEQQLTALGYVTLFGNTNEEPELQDHFLEEVTSRSVSAILMLCAVKSPNIDRLAAHQPCILVNRRLKIAQGAFVRRHRRLPGRPAARRGDRLARGEEGRRAARSGVLGDQLGTRWRGMHERLGELGVRLDERAVVEARLSIASGYQARRAARSRRRFDALFCGNDEIAYGAWRRCRELSIRVPEDVRIYGFDDNPLNQWLAPWLDTVRVPTDAYARESVAQLKAPLGR